MIVKIQSFSCPQKWKVEKQEERVALLCLSFWNSKNKHKLIPSFKELEAQDVICNSIFLTSNIHSNTKPYRFHSPNKSQLLPLLPSLLGNIQGQAAISPHLGDCHNLVNGLLLHCWSVQIISPQNNEKDFSKMWICICWQPFKKNLCFLSLRWNASPLPWPFLIRHYHSIQCFLLLLKYLEPNRNDFIPSVTVDPFFS